MAKKADETVKSEEPTVAAPVSEALVIEEAPKRKMPLRIEPITLSGDYEGWTFFANKNYTLGELEDLLTYKYGPMMRVLRELVTGWSNFVDREGAPIEFVPKMQIPLTGSLPVAGEFPLRQDPWRILGNDLLSAMADGIIGKSAVPNP